MNETVLSEAAMLRVRAARCREIAQNALSEEIAEELSMLAEQYEREAALAEFQDA